MKIINYKSKEQINKIHGVKTSLIYDSPHAMVVHITLEAGEELKPHITPVDVFFFVLEGEPTIMIGEERQKVSANGAFGDFSDKSSAVRSSWQS